MTKSSNDERFEELLKQIAQVPEVPLHRGGGGPIEDSTVGSLIGRYRINERIGEGGMGVVYSATDTRLDRQVALKVLPSRHEGDAARRGLLLREARSAAAVSHPNVAAIYDVGEDKEAFIAMEFVEGRTLREVLAREGPMPLPRVLAIAKQVAAGLAQAHRIGVIHRDLKPDNIMVGDLDVAKLFDFGLARSPLRRPETTSDQGGEEGGLLSLDGNVIGTRPYQSPEQEAGDSVDARTDVYALGVTMYEMCTNEVPSRSAGDDLARLSSTANISSSFVKIIVRCLEPSPDDRYGDGQAVYEALRRCTSRGRRRTRLAVIGALVALATAIAAIFALRNAHQASGLPRLDEPRSPVNEPILKRLTAKAQEAAITHAALSPRGQEVAYAGGQGLFVLSISEGATREVATSPPLDITCPRWFPNGDALLVLGSTERESPSLWKVDVETGNASALGVQTRRCGAISPTGDRVAAVTKEGISLVTVEEPDRTKSVASVDPDAVTDPLVWSPDGRRLAFARAAIEPGGYDIFLETLELATGRRAQLLSEPRLLQESGDVTLAWTPDGRLIYGLAPWTPRRERAGLWVVDLEPTGNESREHRQLVELPNMIVSEVSFDGSGNRLSLLRWESQADIYVAPLESGGREIGAMRRLTLSDRNERPSDWTGVGNELLIVSDERGGHRTAVQSLDEPVARPFVGDNAWTTWPVQVPGSSDVLLWQLPSGVESGRATLMRTTANGENREPLLTTPTEVRVHGNGRPSPRGYWLRCARDAGRCFLSMLDQRGTTTFHEVDLDGGGLSVRGQLSGQTPAWDYGWAITSDGDRIAIADGTIPGIRIVSPGGRSLAELPMRESCEAQFVTWTHDERGVYTTVQCAGHPEPYQIHRLDLDGGHTTLWSTHHAWLSHPLVSPDGSYLAVAVTPCDSDVWLMELR